MGPLNEVTVYANGDSSKLSTWSNIPYFFTETLIAKGIKVNRVDLSPAPIPDFISRILRRLFRAFLKDALPSYFRSYPHFLDARRRIRRAIDAHPDSQAEIFLTFSFSAAGLTRKPVIQFCDWTYSSYLETFEERAPSIFETGCIRREDSQIESSDLIIPLFPGSAKSMLRCYKNREIYYLGNVVNTFYDAPQARIVEEKPHSQHVLFIGRGKYIEGARSLIAAFSYLRQRRPDLILDIVGMEARDFGELPEGVRCYGYLDKGVERERNLYYSLLKQARIFVNTTPKWGAFSATLEAMYFYTPVIVAPYAEFAETFGDDIRFGDYSEKDSPDKLSARIEAILDQPSYPDFCVHAHEAVKDFTWDRFIEKLLDLLKEKLSVQ